MFFLLLPAERLCGRATQLILRGGAAGRSELNALSASNGLQPDGGGAERSESRSVRRDRTAHSFRDSVGRRAMECIRDDPRRTTFSRRRRP